jgi:phosphoglycerate dehydrogenase-like enzyme
LPGWEKPQRIVVWAPFGPQLATRGSRREGLDVTDPEPLPADHPLWRTPRVIITPHVAATSAETYARMQALVTENLRRYIAGEPLLSVVDIQRGY